MANDLQTARDLLATGQKAKARTIFAKLVNANANDEQAWLGFSTCATDVNEKQRCLTEVLQINPQNAYASWTLANLDVSRGFEPGQQDVRVLVRPGTQAFQAAPAAGGTASQPPSIPATAPSGASGLNLMTAAILGVLGVIQVTLPIFLLLASLASLLSEGIGYTGVPLGDALCGSIISIPLGLILLRSISSVRKYGKGVPREMMGLAFIGVLVALGAIVSGSTAILAMCIAPIYFLPVIFVHLEKSRYTN
jgi:hypothetical protein